MHTRPSTLSLSRALHDLPQRARQRGGAGLPMMLLLLGLVVILGLIEVGYLYWSKRDVQKTADLAALAGAQRLEQCTTDYKDNLAARSNAVTDNQFGGELTINCGYWGAELPAGARFVSVSSSHPLNAVQVTASRQSVPMLGQLTSLPRISATAVARRMPPQAAFSVGSRLLNVNSNAPLQGILRLVGVDLTQTQIASYQGLADVKITPRGLLQALGIPVATDINVGDLNNLLAANQVSVGRLLEIMASLAGQQGVAGVDLRLLQQKLLGAGISDVLVQLGSNASSSGLFAKIAGGSEAASGALDIDLNALDLLGTTISIANSKHAVEVPQLDVLGLLKAKASIVEPASIGIGPVGTTAYNSQVRLFLDIDSQRIPALGAVLNWLGTRIKLPTYIDVIDGYGQLTAINCSVQPATATVDVTSAIANVCIGKATTPWNSTRELCRTGLSEEILVSLLGRDVLTRKISLEALSQRDQLILSEGQIGTVKPNDLKVGKLVSDLVDALLGTVQSLFTPQGNSSTAAKDLAVQYLEATKKNGLYQPAVVVQALKEGNSAANLPALGSWTTEIPTCDSWILGCTPKKVQGEVWQGFLYETTISKPSVLGGLLDVLGLTSCQGLIAGLAFNDCVSNALAKYLQTKPGGLSGNGSYNPVTGGGTCSSALCLLLKPVVDSILRPLLDGVGKLLSQLLSEVLGLQLGRTDVHMQSIQCGRGQLVE
ncbi:TadG family pilus assembly protein [Stenotrophomonas pigmentata]|uniref:TadG family pilus assembly protein n=1 Tax=Stenotrophomonas pigmentata TaxID=3055080 RepID=UPI0026ED25B5|nr:TadG family pilus assembly protein [Stenotrophomonas sp. 610A2]